MRNLGTRTVHQRAQTVNELVSLGTCNNGRFVILLLPDPGSTPRQTLALLASTLFQHGQLVGACGGWSQTEVKHLDKLCVLTSSEPHKLCAGAKRIVDGGPQLMVGWLHKDIEHCFANVLCTLEPSTR